MPGISALTASLGSDNDADSFRRLEQSAKSKKTSEMPRGTGTTDEVRMVNCYIEEKDEEEVRKKRKSKWLHDKWGGLFVVLAADGDDPEVTGTIYGFEWNEQAGCQVCTVEDTTDILTPVGVQEVPTMVKNARQAEEVLLVSKRVRMYMSQMTVVTYTGWMLPPTLRRWTWSTMNRT